MLVFSNYLVSNSPLCWKRPIYTGLALNCFFGIKIPHMNDIICSQLNRTNDLTTGKTLLSPLFPYRFCTGDRTGDLLQNWTLYTTVLFLLPGYSRLPAGHNGCSHAHLEHFTSP